MVGGVLGETAVVPGAVSMPGLAQPPTLTPPPIAPPPPAPLRTPPPGNCFATSVGPGIAPPPALATGVAGFHASYSGQSRHPTPGPGGPATAGGAFYNP